MNNDATGVMSGLIGANNKFGQQFNNPDANMQGIITSIYGRSESFTFDVHTSHNHVT